MPSETCEDEFYEKHYSFESSLLNVFYLINKPINQDKDDVELIVCKCPKRLSIKSALKGQIFVRNVEQSMSKIRSNVISFIAAWPLEKRLEDALNDPNCDQKFF
ncbi:unnamed protein product [Caenorhabditis sp. 36 PRJEB53466]|nr:unnamed protein product [Caenorhabditis sp. 36 PRJEB53466]